MSGYFGDLSLQQKDALLQFKTALQDIPNKPKDTDPDRYYLRWLRASMDKKMNFDVGKAVMNFKNVC